MSGGRHFNWKGCLYDEAANARFGSKVIQEGSGETAGISFAPLRPIRQQDPLVRSGDPKL